MVEAATSFFYFVSWNFYWRFNRILIYHQFLGISGFSIGALYALRIRHQRPMALALGAALNLGMLGGLFAGFHIYVGFTVEKVSENWDR